MKRGSDKKRRKEKGKGVVWSKRHNSFHTLLKAIHKSSTVTRNRSKDTKGVTQSHLPEMKRGEKIDKEYFCLSAGSSSTPRLASKISITLLYEMSQVFPSSFALLCSSPFLLWSCHPLWAVIIGRGLSVSSVQGWKLLPLRCCHCVNWTDTYRHESSKPEETEKTCLTDVWTAEKYWIYLQDILRN